MLQKIIIATTLTMAVTAAAQAADDTYNLNFNEAVQQAVADGTLDGSVKFYLASKGRGKIIQSGVVTNKKTNSFGKSPEVACDWVLRSALIQLQNTAKKKGANAVTNIVSYYKSKETRSSTTYECHKGAVIAGVALKGDLARL
ncbi:excinuclease [Acinetobacter sp. MD2(2019)]|uniref:excinuclease n=1 Tax=Acinetobacter sp. MD2(2019) TaxID=2605273 RepID=UPI002D1F78A7|nr:excinuclease [Acinetobacter sp. MD2(2019)]